MANNNGAEERLVERYEPTKKEFQAAVDRQKAARAEGIGPKGHTLYSLDSLRNAIDECQSNIDGFYEAIDGQEQNRRDLRAILREQTEIQERLSKGEYVEGYSPPRE